MTWLAWRQFRLSGVAVYALIAAVAVAFVLVSLPDLTGARLIETLSQGGSEAGLYGFGVFAMLVLPAVIGVFWGAPLVARELEAGTHRLAWTQSISRTRWLTTKVGLVGLAAVVGVGLLSALVTWWCGPIDDALNGGAQSGSGFLEQARMDPVIFAARGIVPIGYAAFAFALGVAAGTVVRRTVPAMALTLVAFFAVQVFGAPMVRAQLGPTERTTAITAENMRGLGISGVGPTGEPRGPVRHVTISIDSPGGWEIANETVRAGTVQSTLPSWVVACVPNREFGPPGVKSDPACFQRLAREGYRQHLAYMPASRYWTLQAYELIGFLALAAALLGGTFWWIRHRVS